MNKRVSVLVTGATGKQGGAVARRLLERGHRVRALTRNAASPAAAALAKGGAEIAVGSLDDRAAVARALEGTDAVFAMSTPFEAGTGAETRQGITVADAAKAAGVHLVFTSVGSAHRATGIPHFESKYAVEKHIAAIGAAATVIRPVYFMDNATTYGRDALKNAVYATPLTPARPVAQVAVDDIAAFAALAIENESRFVGTQTDIAGEDVSGEKAVEILSRVTGRKFSYFKVPMDAIRAQMGEDGVIMYEYFERAGYVVDYPALRRDFPEIRWHSFEDWAKAQDWKAIFGA